MMSASYFMKFRGKEFEDHVVEKFHNLFPTMVGSTDLKLALKHIKFKSIVPEYKDNDGEADKRYTRGISNTLAAECIPAALESPLSPSKYDEQCKRNTSEPKGPGTPRQGPEVLGMVKKFSKTKVEDYHTYQRYLFDGLLLNIKLDLDGRVLVNRSRTTTTTTTTTSATTTTVETITFTHGQLPATTEEFVQLIDSLSKYVMDEYEASEQPTAHPDLELDKLNKKIDLCFKILIGRLLIQLDSMESKNDFMTEKGWTAWREHAWVVASFAVYFLSLQLYRYKKCGTFLNMNE